MNSKKISDKISHKLLMMPIFTVFDFLFVNELGFIHFQKLSYKFSKTFCGWFRVSFNCLLSS